MFNNDVTVVFCTCDKYEDLWYDFFRLFKKYWPEFEGRIILNTESKAFRYDGLDISEPLNCSSNVSWSDRLSLSLKKVKTPYTLIMLDDFYLKASVDNDRFRSTLKFMKNSSKVVSVTYLCEPGVKTAPTELSGFYQRKKFTPYKITTHITLYKTDYLLALLKKNETAWEFEVNGTIRSWFKTGEFMGPINNEFPIFSYDFGALVIRGSFLKSVKEYFENKENCVFNTERSVIESWGEAGQGGFFKKIKYLIKGLLSFVKGKAL